MRTTMIYTHVLNGNGRAVRTAVDSKGRWRIIRAPYKMPGRGADRSDGHEQWRARDSRSNREASRGMMMIESSVNGESQLNSKWFA